MDDDIDAAESYDEVISQRRDGVEVEQVKTTEQDVQQALTSYAAPAVAAPVASSVRR